MNQSFDLTEMFDALRAEAESAWLAQAFLPPRDFGLISGSSSVFVTGVEGGGKTALELLLKDFAKQKKGKRILVTSWRLSLPDEMVSSAQVTEIFMSQTMDALSFSFLQKIAAEPDIYLSAPSWSQDFMRWFVQKYLQGDHDFHARRLTEHADPQGTDCVNQILTVEPRSLFSQSSSLTVLPNLTATIKEFGFEGIWIFIDGLSALFHNSPAQVEVFLGNFLSTLEFFEDPAFAFKVIIPVELGQKLQKVRSIVTRRFKTYPLQWRENDLTTVIERRVALLLGRNKISLADICKDEKWLEWLRKYGGDTPRGWLDLAKPVIAAYLEKKKSLVKNEWLESYRQSPPLLRLDLENSQAFLGYGKVDVPATGYKMLAYLYENRHRACTKSELYYFVYQGLEKEPKTPDDTGWEDGVSWEGMMDTALYRLRQAIEWDKAPLYIVSERGRGQIRLENTM